MSQVLLAPSPAPYALSWEQWASLGAGVTAAIGLLFGVFAFANSLSSEKHPRMVASILSIAIVVILVIGTQLIAGLWVIDLSVALIGAFFTLFILWGLTKKDKKALKFAGEIFESLYLIDEQLTYILRELAFFGSSEAINKAISRAMLYVITRVLESLSLDNPYEMRASIMRAENGRFKVLESHEIKTHHISLIEEKLSYGRKIAGIAGLAAERLKPVCINDLSDVRNRDTDYWVRIDTEEKGGSIFCYPIINGKGDGKPNSEQVLMGVFSVSCERNDAFLCDSIPQVLDHYSVKIEMLLHCLALAGHP